MGQKVFQGKTIEAFSFRVRHKKGHFVWLEFLSSAVYEGGEISYFVTSARDITQRVLSKKKLQDSLEELEKKEHSLEGASKVAKIGYWEYDIKTDTFTWSDYMYTIYGMDPINGIPSKKELLSLYDEESQEKILQALKDVAVKGVSCDVELRFVNKQNEVVWERTVAQSIYNQQNEIVGRIGIMQDITAFKKAQFEEKLSKEKIQSSLELLEKKDYALNEVSRKINELFIKSDIKLEYFAIRDLKTLQHANDSDLIALIAVYLGEIRLIDNIIIKSNPQ